MIPIKLSLEGFTSYRHKQEISFEGFDVACVSGSNGAGKSSLLDAITYALYGKARKNDEAIINSASPKAVVALEFSYEGGIYRIIRQITRGKGGQVEFYIFNPADGLWKTLNGHSATETNAKIEQTLRLDYETFINASFFLQGKADSFATKKPAERKQILASILGLDEWERYKEAAKERRFLRESDLKFNASRIEESRLEIAEEAARKAAVTELDLQRAEAHARVADLQLELERARAEEGKLAGKREALNQLKQRLNKAETSQAETIRAIDQRQTQLKAFEIELARADEVKAAYEVLRTMRFDLAAMDSLASQAGPVETERRNLAEKIAREKAALMSEQRLLKEQEAMLQAQLESAESIRAETQTVSGEIASLEEETSAREEIESALVERQAQSAEAGAELAQVEARANETKERVATLMQVEDANCPLCGQPLDKIEREELIQQLNDKVESLRKYYLELKTNRVNLLHEQETLQTRRRDLGKIEQRLNASKVKLEGLNKRLEMIAQAQAEWQAGGAERLNAVGLMLEKDNFLPKERAQISELDKQLLGYGYDADAHQTLRAKVHELEPVEEQVRHLDLAANNAKNLKETLAELENRLKKESADAESITKEHDQLAAQLAAESVGIADLHALQIELDHAHQDEAELISRLGGAKQRLNAVAVQKERVQSLEQESKAIRVEIDQLKLCERSFGKDGVPAMLIEEALPELEERSNEILRRLSNDTLSVSFNTKRDYKDTRRKDKQDTLDILISDGSSTRDYETYSGGEAFRVNFAIRLALSHVLANRAGARLQTLVVDEGFGNQDSEGRARLIEAINLVRNDFAKVLVITHIEELKEAFNSRIEITKTAEGSQIEVLAA